MRHYPTRLARTALWSRRLALFAAGVVAMGLAFARIGAIQPTQGLIVSAAGFVLAAIALVLALAAYLDIWRTGAVGMAGANTGFVLALALLIYPGWQISRAYSLPAIHDISTDLKDPPAFSRARGALAARNGHVPGDSAPDVRDQQRRAYVDLQPVTLELGPDEAFDLVIEVLKELKWQVIDQSPPSARSGQGRVDAIDRTPILKFADDITIRIRPLANQTRIDIRSVSRSGRHDLGANAARIRRFSETLTDFSKGT